MFAQSVVAKATITVLGVYLTRRRVSAPRRRGAVDQDGQAVALGGGGPVRVRLRRGARAWPRDRAAQGRRHAAVGRPVLAGVPVRERGAPGRRVRRGEAGQVLPARDPRPGPVRRAAHAQPVRVAGRRGVRGAGRRRGHRAHGRVRAPGRRVRHDGRQRGGRPMRTGVRPARRRQPDGPDPGGRVDAVPRGRGGRGGAPGRGPARGHPAGRPDPGHGRRRVLRTVRRRRRLQHATAAADRRRTRPPVSVKPPPPPPPSRVPFLPSFATVHCRDTKICRRTSREQFCFFAAK